MDTITIDLSAEGIVTAQQMRQALGTLQAETQQARRQLIANQKQELAAVDERLRLIGLRLADLDDFIAIKGTR